MPILGTVGIADKGNYSADVTYNKGNFVYHKGSSWLALKDNLRGVTPEEGENWKYLARGFQAELLSAVLATDTTGLVGTAGEQVGAQALMDKVSDMIATKVMMKSDVVSQIVNDATKAASMAALYSVNEYAKSVNKRVDDTNSNFTPQIGTITSDYANVDGILLRFGRICIAHGSFTITKAVPSGTNPFMSFSFRPVKYTWPAINIAGIQTGNTWLNTLGNIGCSFSIESGKTGNFGVVYITN